MRCGELLGLRWQDVNSLLGTFTIEQTFKRLWTTEGTVQLYQTPKTKAGHRTLPTAQVVADMFRQIREQQTLDKLAFGSEYEDHDLVFCQPNGRPLHHRNLVWRDFAPLVKKAGLPKIRFHDLRHSAVSIMIGELKIDPVTVAHIVGHRAAGFTARVYGHAILSVVVDAVNKIEAAYFPGKEKVRDNS